jgi:hypothetical protein
MNPVSKAIRACYQLGAKEVHVDVVMAIGDVVAIPGWIGRTTPFVLGKTLFGVLSNFFLRFFFIINLIKRFATRKNCFSKSCH